MSYYAPTKSLDFSTKLSPNIQRIVDPHNCPAFSDPSPCARTNAGSAEMQATLSLAHDADGNIYIADLSGVTKITNGSLDTQARPVPGLNLGVYTAMAFDSANNRIYAGTTNPEGVDWIDILDRHSNTTGTYSVGLDGITAISADPTSTPHSGRLDVVDDPGIKQVGEDLARHRAPFHRRLRAVRATTHDHRRPRGDRQRPGGDLLLRQPVADDVLLLAGPGARDRVRHRDRRVR